MDDRKLTYKQLSELTGIPTGTLYSLVHNKKIPHIRLGKRFIRFSKIEVDSWMRSQYVNVQVSHG